MPAFGGQTPNLWFKYRLWRANDKVYKVYVLKSKKGNKRYIGYSGDIINRFKEHNQEKVKSTLKRRPLELIYYEEYSNELKAKRRERFLKSGQGRKLLDKILLARGEP